MSRRRRVCGRCGSPQVLTLFGGLPFEEIDPASAGKLAGWPIKPDPALALDICRRLAVTPAATALVGDSGSDMETALRAGMVPVGVRWGFRSETELTGHGAIWLAEQPAGLLRYLTGATGEEAR